MYLTVQIREKVGASATNAVRAKGLIPVEIYGHRFQNIHAAVSIKDFTKVYTVVGETTVITVALQNEKMPALIYAVARDPRTDAIIHADLYRVRMDEKITAHVPIEFIGESPAVKAGGVLVKAMHEIEVEALPGDMPHSFIINLSRIAEMGQSIHIKDIVLEGAALKSAIIKVAPDMVLATVIAPRAEEEVVAPAVSIEDVKVEGEEKKIQKEKEKAAEHADAV